MNLDTELSKSKLWRLYLQGKVVIINSKNMETKPFWSSKTIWGITISLAMYAVQAFHLPIAEGELTSLVMHGWEVFGILLAIYGSIAAEKQLTVK